MESSIANNPLAKHFRQPSIYLKLPSGGKFYPEGTLDLGITGEIPIYPMTVKDELLLRTPDALMNGDSMAQMIKSCCPNIKDPWVIPLTDLDPILIAIRLASYGGDLDLTSNCTHCNEENEHTIKLSVVLDSLTPTSMFDQSHLIDGLIFDLKPQQFKELNVVGQITFEQRKLISAIENGDLGDEEKKALFYQSFKRLTDLNIGTLVSCIKSITTEDGTIVNESAVIKDFLINADRGTYEEIKNTVNTALTASKVPPMSLPCSNCKQHYKVDVDFNQTNFFE
jgi:hypothetical protein